MPLDSCGPSHRGNPRLAPPGAPLHTTVCQVTSQGTQMPRADNSSYSGHWYWEPPRRHTLSGGELWFSSLNSGSELRSATPLPHKVPLLKGNGVKWKGSHLGSCQRSAADRRWPGNGLILVAEPPAQTEISQSSPGQKKKMVSNGQRP